ncbi:MAG: c-type cytochrome [Bacteroidia bacterium]
MDEFKNIVHKLVNSIIFLVLLIFGLAAFIIYDAFHITRIEPRVITIDAPSSTSESGSSHNEYKLPDTASIPNTEEGKMIRYGRQLITNTSGYLGRNGSVGIFLPNSMNCESCHLDAGTKPYCFNFTAVHANYPKYRDRAGMIVTETQRVNDCMTRSLNGKELDPNSKEMLAILSYIKWVGKKTIIGEKVKGFEPDNLPFMDRAADPGKGKNVFMKNCRSCHGADGQGLMWTDVKRYPPLWGDSSFNDAAATNRLTILARYVKNNMPFGTSYDNPLLTDEEAWDVAAFVISQPRMHKKEVEQDFPDVKTKAIDYSFGPYPDNFSREQHKFGPYKPIIEADEKASGNKI